MRIKWTYAVMCAGALGLLVFSPSAAHAAWYGDDAVISVNSMGDDSSGVVESGEGSGLVGSTESPDNRTIDLYAQGLVEADGTDGQWNGTTYNRAASSSEGMTATVSRHYVYTGSGGSATVVVVGSASTATTGTMAMVRYAYSEVDMPLGGILWSETHGFMNADDASTDSAPPSGYDTLTLSATGTVSANVDVHGYC